MWVVVVECPMNLRNMRQSETTPRGWRALGPKKDKKIPAGYPAGEGGMVEEIYIHYYRHLIRIKSYTFLKKNFKKL